MAEATVQGAALNAGNQSIAVGIGVNSVTTNNAYTMLGYTVAGAIISLHAHYKGRPGLGKIDLKWLEYGAASTTWYGDGGVPAIFQSSIGGSLLN